MSLIKTHHEKIQVADQSETIYGEDSIYQVVYGLVLENPGLVVDTDFENMDKRHVKNIIAKFIDKHANIVKENRDLIIEKTINYMFGYGVLQGLIDDDDISDIDGTRYDYFTVKKNGVTEKTAITFRSEKEFENYCKLLAIRNDGLLNESDNHTRVADYKNKLRINLAIGPRNITGPSINIRKHRKNPYNLMDLKNLEMFDDAIYFFLHAMMKSSLRLLISGKGASGKTTLLRALLREINSDHRLLVCESDSELFPTNKNFIVQRVKKDQKKGKGISLETLVKDGLTMSLDGYCVGEIVGGEAWDYVQAGYTDHRTLGTLHSSSAVDVMDRLEMLVDSGQGKIANDKLRYIIANSVDVVIHLKDFRIDEIIGVNGYSIEKGAYDTDQIFKGSLDPMSNMSVYSKIGKLKGKVAYELKGIGYEFQ